MQRGSPEIWNRVIQGKNREKEKTQKKKKQGKRKPTPTEVSSSASESPKEPLADWLKLDLPQNWKENNDFVNLSSPFNIRIGTDDLPSGCQIKHRKNCKYCFLSQSGIQKVYKATQKTVAPKKTTSNFDFVKILSPPEDDVDGGKQRREEIL